MCREQVRDRSLAEAAVGELKREFQMQCQPEGDDRAACERRRSGGFESGSPYSRLGAIAGLAYLLAVVVLGLRG